MARDQLRDNTARGLIGSYRTGERTPTDVLQETVARIAELDARYRAVYVVDVDAAGEAAAASAARWRRGEPIGPLDGVPVTIKENIAKRGLPQAFGTAAGEPVCADENAPVTDRLLEAGAVLVATTTMPDFSGLPSGTSSRHGIARNCWNPAWNTGGSSSGAAVSAGLGFAPINIGTDIGGSIRIPAAMNAVFGFKPSFGRVPILDTYLGRCAGPLTRTVADAATAMSVLALPDRRDPTSLPPAEIDWSAPMTSVRGLRVGLALEPVAGMQTDPEILEAVERAADVFAAAGAELHRVGPYLANDYLRSGLVPFLTAHLWSQMQDDRFAGELDRANQDMVAAVSRVDSLTSLELVRAHDSISVLVRETVDMLDDFDVVLSPTTGVLAGAAESAMLDQPSMSANFTGAFNAAGTPAASINCGFSRDGRPIGLQLAAGRWQDLRVLQAAGSYEATRPSTATPPWSQISAITPPNQTTSAPGAAQPRPLTTRSKR